jgi:hypothetical protein
MTANDSTQKIKRVEPFGKTASRPSTVSTSLHVLTAEDIPFCCLIIVVGIIAPDWGAPTYQIYILVLI